MAAGGWVTVHEAAGESAFTNSLVLRYGFRLSNPTGRPLTNVTLRARAPALCTATQRLRALDCLPAAALASASDGAWLAFRLPRLAPYASEELSIRARLDTRSAPADWPAPPSAATAALAPLAPALASGLKPFELAGVDAVTARVRGAVRYTGYHAADRGLGWTLERREGDCSEQASLAALALRRAGLPACRALGVVARESRVLRASDLHEWCLALDDTRWRVADPPAEASVPDGAAIAFGFAPPAVDPGEGLRFFTVEPREARGEMR